MTRSRALRARHAHLVGIGGTGMSALAGYLMDTGACVTGSDTRRSAAVRSLEASGVRIASGHAARNLPSRADLVVRSVAVSPEEPELLAARERGVEILTYPQAIARITHDRFTCAVAGTHGKSTTTAMLAHVLSELGEDPSWIFGGAIAGRGLPPWRVGDGVVVLEACEYARSFEQIRPDLAVITAIDDDHLDCYGDLAGVRTAFAEYGQRVLERGGSVAVADDLGLDVELGPLAASGAMLRFGIGSRSGLSAEGIETSSAGTHFVLVDSGERRQHVTLGLPGMHNVHNALGAMAAAIARGHELADVARAMMSFRGLARRLECLGTRDGAVVYDDYAHHPTAVAAVLSSLAAAHPGRRLVAVFEPHQVTRTMRHFSSFATALERADHVAITEIYSARDRDSGEISGAALAARLSSRGGSSAFTPGLEDVLDHLDQVVSPGDVVVLMGAGDIGDAFAGVWRERGVARSLGASA